jgi:hypothetical protein
LIDKPTLPLKKWNYKGREEVSDIVTTMLDSWIVHLFEGKFQKNDLSYNNKEGIFGTFKSVAEFLLGKYIFAEV